MAKFKVDIASIASVPGKPQPIQIIKPTQVAITALSENGNNIALNNASQITIPVIDRPATQSSAQIVVPISTPVQSVFKFGSYPNDITRYPNDVVRFDLYNANNVYLGTNYRIDTAYFQETTEGSTVVFDVEQDVQRLGYLAGRYNYTYRFHRNILGSGDGHKLRIQEISFNALEVRVQPVTSQILSNESFLDFFSNGIFQIAKSQLLTNLVLIKDEQTVVPIFDFVQDKFTISEHPYSIIFKLSSPLPAGTIVGDEIWIAQQVSVDYSDIATLTPPNLKPPTRAIAGANFDTIARLSTQVSTEYKDREDLLTTNTQVKAQLQEKLVSSSRTEGIELNQDFTEFAKFITYSSAEARLRGFYYKLQQIESFDNRIKELTTDLTGLPSSSATSSAAFLNNITLTQNRRSAVIGAFDAYERYLYYESASYVTNSYGEFWSTTWPKTNSTKPYTNYSVTSSQGLSWLDGAIESASIYDASNVKSLNRSTPTHIIEDSDNENYLTLVNVAGHYFDNILPYIQQIPEQYDRNESISEGLSKDLLYVVGQNFGFEFEDGSTLDDLWSYALGVDATGSVNTAYQTTTGDSMRGIWKRIVNNLPYLIRTKGTERGLRALINCFGIPDTILRIREYGGHEADFDTKTDYTFNRFYYALKVGYNGQVSGSISVGSLYGSGVYGSGVYGLPAGVVYGSGVYGSGVFGAGYTYGSGVYGSTPYGGPLIVSTTNPNQSVQIPWQALSQSGLFPETTELRVKMVANQTKDQTIFEVPDQWKVRAFISGGYNYLGFFLSGSQGWATASVSSSIYNNRWHSLTLRRENNTDVPSENQTYTLIAKQTNYLKVVTTHTASLAIDGSTSSSYNSTFLTAGNLWIPGSGSFTIAQSHSMDVLSGSVQEFRYWASALDDDILDNHTLTPTSFQGNTDGVFTGSTSSFDTLAYRLAFGTDNNKTVDLFYPTTTSFTSQHPDQNTTLPAAAFYNFTSSTYEAVIEENSLEWPDLGANRSISNKVRIDSTVLAGNQLFPDTKAEKPLTDNYPIDSPRLGVYLSPTNEINKDIAEQFGGISIDDFIGDPTYLELDNYPALDQLKREYAKKYTSLNRPNQYCRILQHYNAAIFQLIKRFVPYRANTQVGLVIEPTILERSKVTIKHPTVSDNTYSGSIDLPEVATTAGEVEDPTNSPLANYVQEGVIDGRSAEYLNLEGSGQQIIPIDVDGIDLGSALVSGENYQEVDGTIDTGENGAGWNSRYLGSKYVYMTYASSGSNPRVLTYVTASRYDEYEAVQPSIGTSTYSTQIAPANQMYDQNIYFDRLFTGQRAFTASVVFSSSEATVAHPLTNKYGLRLAPSLSGSTQYTPFGTDFSWAIDPTNGFYFKSYLSMNQTRTGSFAIDAFMYEPTDRHTYDYLYRVTVKTSVTASGNTTGSLVLYFGGFGSTLTQSYTLAGTQTNTIVTRATGTELAVHLQANDLNSTEFLKILDLKVEPLNYRAQVQDYHLLSARGMINARYEGCKMTSTDYNVDSPDTIDNGPVITVITVNGNVLTTAPAQGGGTFRSG